MDKTNQKFQSLDEEQRKFDTLQSISIAQERHPYGVEWVLHGKNWPSQTDAIRLPDGQIALLWTVGRWLVTKSSEDEPKMAISNLPIT